MDIPAGFLGWYVQGLGHRVEAVEAAALVQFKVQVKHRAFAALPAEPPATGPDGDRQLDQGEGFARLAGSGDQHLVAFPEDAVDQLRRQLRRIGAHKVRRVLDRRQADLVDDLAVVPFLPAVGLGFVRNDKLLLLAPDQAGHPAQAAGILVILVDADARFFADLEQLRHAGLVLFQGQRVDVDDSVGALSAAGHQDCHRQLQLVHDVDLRLDGRAVGFHQGVAVAGDVLLLPALAVRRIEIDPAAGVGVVAAQGAGYVVILLQGLDQLVPRPPEMAAVGLEFAVLGDVAVEGIADLVFRSEQDLEIPDDLLDGVPAGAGLLDGDLLRLIEERGVRPHGQRVVPVQGVAGAAVAPAELLRQVDDGAAADPLALEAVPFGLHLAGLIAGVAGAPVAPERDIRPDGLERHAHVDPFAVRQLGGIDRPQSVCQRGINHQSSPPSSLGIR